jgi:NAD(P)-dependent dehydrogenase (short-subunit alcohol dehydrogenase family)
MRTPQPGPRGSEHAMTLSLTGRTALVTGAGRGIGRAIAIGLARAGADVLVTARSPNELAGTVAAIEAAGPGAGQARAVAADLTDDRQRQRVINARRTRRIDVLVNNAATVEPLGTFTAIRGGDLRDAFELNVIAPAALAAAVIPEMVEVGWGRIVNISSGVAANPGFMIGGSAYAATKAALEASTRNLAAELAGTGVTVNVYRPGGVDTAMQAWIRSQDPARIGHALHERFHRSYASGGLLTPETSAAALLGHLLGPDGGQTGAIWDLEQTVAVDGSLGGEQGQARRLPGVLGGAACGDEQASIIVAARTAGEQVRGHAGVVAGRRLGSAGEHKLDIDIEDAQSLVAAHVARIGAQKLVQLPPARHDRLTGSRSAGPSAGTARYPLATSAARSLRRASNIVL